MAKNDKSNERKGSGAGPRPRNRWDDPKSIRRKDFAKGEVKPGMAPAEALIETMFCQDFTDAYNRKRARTHEAVHHIRLDREGLAPVPDISFLDGEWATQVIIEVDEEASKAQAAQKARNALEKYGVLEALVYCIDSGYWYRIDALAEADLLTMTSWSVVLNTDLEHNKVKIKKPV
jgi:hypothetical protein